MNSFGRIYCCLNCAHLDDETLRCMNNEKRFSITKIGVNIQCDDYIYLPGSDAEEHPLYGLQEVDTKNWFKQNLRNIDYE